MMTGNKANASNAIAVGGDAATRENTSRRPGDPDWIAPTVLRARAAARDHTGEGVEVSTRPRVRRVP